MFDKLDAGLIHILRGTPSGLQHSSQTITQDDEGVEDVAESDDRFGRVLATGDFTADGADNLALGLLYEDVRFVGLTRVDAGAVQIFPGLGDESDFRVDERNDIFLDRDLRFGDVSTENYLGDRSPSDASTPTITMILPSVSTARP